MTGLLEACQVHAGSQLPAVLIAPRTDRVADADALWRHLQSSPVEAGQAIDVRSATWLVTDVAEWRGRPGGVRLRLRLCNASGQLRPRPTATTSGHGVTISGTGELPIFGALTVTATTDQDGRVVTAGELLPANSWSGQSGDLVVLDDDSTWEQVGDPTMTVPPVVQLRRLRVS